MMIIKQIEVGYMDNFCYNVGCEDTHQALVIDPGSDVERILSVADKEGLKIVTIVNTHGHSDHTILWPGHN
jgi:glyoxylase-like metal-dependent hydrolase (beta-lactamase superfamily II)